MRYPAAEVINWRKVESSNVDSVGWPKPGVILFEDQVGVNGKPYEPRLALVKFTSGTLYGYIGVSRQRVVAMARAKSVGEYLNSKIKPNYKAVRIA